MKACIIIQFKRKKREIREKSEKEKRERFHENYKIKKRRASVTTHRRERYQIREGRSMTIPQPIRLVCDYEQ